MDKKLSIQIEKFGEDFEDLSENDSDISEILTGKIFLGPAYLIEVNSPKELKKRNITHVINLCQNLEYNHNNRFKILHLPIKDRSTEDISKYFDLANNFIKDALQNDGKVFIHCQKGISRSPSIVIAFIGKYMNKKFDDAYQFVKGKRPKIDPNIGFIINLMEYLT